jgi:hypothetical protein
MNEDLSDEYKMGNREAHTLWLRHVADGMIRLAYTYQLALKEGTNLEDDLGVPEGTTETALHTLEVCYEAYAALLESMVSHHGFTVPALADLPDNRDLAFKDILRAPEMPPGFFTYGPFSMN